LIWNRPDAAKRLNLRPSAIVGACRPPNIFGQIVRCNSSTNPARNKESFNSPPPSHNIPISTSNHSVFFRLVYPEVPAQNAAGGFQIETRPFYCRLQINLEIRAANNFNADLESVGFQAAPDELALAT
jgi:hypothetical protein